MTSRATLADVNRISTFITLFIFSPKNYEENYKKISVPNTKYFYRNIIIISLFIIIISLQIGIHPFIFIRTRTYNVRILSRIFIFITYTILGILYCGKEK